MASEHEVSQEQIAQLAKDMQEAVEKLFVAPAKIPYTDKASLSTVKMFMDAYRRILPDYDLELIKVEGSTLEIAIKQRPSITISIQVEG